MGRANLNLLFTLDALLSEGSVTRAAARLRLSPSAMSRALSHLREVTGDPLLVRAGRRLVPTPRALALRETVPDLVRQAQAALQPDMALDLSRLDRTFTLRTSDGFVENFGAALIARTGREAPRARLHFLQKLDKDSRLLREGRIDLETGIVEGATGPELRTQSLFRDTLVAIVREGHPLTKAGVTPALYAETGHVVVSRDGTDQGALDRPFLPEGVSRRVVAVVSGFSEALALARRSDLVATAPERHTAAMREGLICLPLPFPPAGFTVSMLWHPRLEADPAHRWLRGCVREVCGATS